MNKLLLLSLVSVYTRAALIVDFSATDAISALGSPQVQNGEADLIENPTSKGSDKSQAYITQGEDPDTKRRCLHFHREPAQRRAEVKAKGEYNEGKKYFIGWEFRLSNTHPHLSLFQW